MPDSIDPTDEVPWELLAAYLAGELAPEERARVAAWLAAEPRREELLESLRLVWDGSAAGRRRYNVEAALRRVAAESARPPAPLRRPLAPTVWGRAPLWKRGLVAASVVGAAVGGWWLVARGVRENPAPVASKEYRTTRGQRLALKLADGSSILLAPASVLRIDPGYGAGARPVQLAGEAYFEVAHDAARPFSVRTSRTVIRDLGTRFVVRAYAEEPVTDVVVAEGRVAVGPIAPAPGPVPDSLLLDPGDRGWLSADGSLTLARTVNLDGYFGWTEGRLVFRNTPLSEALRRIGRWYDVDVRLVDPGLSTRTLTASFHHEPAAEVVRLVATTFGLRVERHGATFVLRAPTE